ncbi:MAG: copper homeostasis protein CutC, partial [Pyrinomonadaceae bacterium]
MSIKIEVCVDTVESAVAAQQGGADRVELCDNLFEGGTTPSYGAIKKARELLNIGLHVLIRPRAGDFLYSLQEIEIMRLDIEVAKELDADGVVFGVLCEDGRINTSVTRELIELARPMSVTFHRAFDVSADALLAMKELMAVGVDRVLTSGQAPNAFEGFETIKRLNEFAGDDLKILACGELNAENVKRFIGLTNVKEVHLTGFASIETSMNFRNSAVYMG